MSDPISKIELKLWTSIRPCSSTPGRVYLGIAGREYAVNRQGNFTDFQGSPDAVTYIFGEGSNVDRSQDNDPRTPWQTDASDVPRCPLYIRFAPTGNDDNWDLERADLDVTFQGTTPGSQEQTVQFHRLDGLGHLWLGVQRGQFLYF